MRLLQDSELRFWHSFILLQGVGGAIDWRGGFSAIAGRLGTVGRDWLLYDLEGVLGPRVIDFVGHYVRSLLAWDILVFFDRNPEAVLDVEGLANRLGRRPEEVGPEVDALCQARILQCAGGLIRYKPTDEMRESVGEFVLACQDRSRRLALIALVLQRISRSPGDF